VKAKRKPTYLALHNTKDGGIAPITKRMQTRAKATATAENYADKHPHKAAAVVRRVKLIKAKKR
jgi:hypothetical protein